MASERFGQDHLTSPRKTTMAAASPVKDPRQEVIQACYVDSSDEDQTLPHHKDSIEFLSLQQLEGKLHAKDTDKYETDDYLKKICEEHGYSYVAMRLFVGNPVWTPFNRPHDHLSARKDYRQALCERKLEGMAVDASA